MIDKIKELLGSIRFYVATFAWLSNYLSLVSANGFDLTVSFEQIALWLGTIAAVGAADSVATKLSSKKEQ